MAQIDNLEIHITADADAAIQALNALASSLNNVRGAASGASGGLRNVAQGAQAAQDQMVRTQGGVDRTRISFSRLWDTIRRGGGVFGSLVGAARSVLGVFPRITSGLLRMARIRIYRAIIKDMGQAFKDLYGWSKLFGTDFADSVDRIHTSFTYLRNSMVAMVAPLVNALAPALDMIIDRVVEVLNWFNQLFAALSGASTYTVAKKVASSWEDSFGSASNSARHAAEEIKRTILGFDEINKLQKQNESSSGGGSGSSPYSSGYSTMFEEKELTGGFKGFSDAIENALNDTMSRIGLIVSGATLALGAILTFSGTNVPLGLGLMAAGAAGLATVIAVNWDGMDGNVKIAIGAVETVLGGALLGLGAVMAFSGAHIGLGLGLMVAGAATLASAVVLNWDILKENVTGVADAIGLVISGASLAIGAILAFSGVAPALGIGLIAGGVVGFAATLDWEWLGGKIGGKINAITTTVSVASLALGAILTFSGVAPGLGLALMAAGGVGLATEIAANWNWIIETVGAAITALGNYLVEHKDEILSIGSDIWNGIINGIKKAAEDVYLWIKTNIFDPVWGGIKKIFGIASPAKTMIGPGEEIMNGVLAGILNVMGTIGEWIAENVFKGLLGALTLSGEVLVSLAHVGVSIIGEILGGILSVMGNIAGWVANKIIKPLVDAFTTSSEEEQGNDFASNLWDAIKKKWGSNGRDLTVNLVSDKTAQDVWDELSAAWGEIENKNITVNATAVKGSDWNDTAWLAATMTPFSVTRTVNAVAKKGDWDDTAWLAANMTGYTATRTVNAVVQKGKTWDKDAWSAANMTSYSPTRTVTSEVKKGKNWNSDAWTAAKMTSYSPTRTITSNVKKGKTWNSDAWLAAKMTNYSPTRTITSNVKKGKTWNNDAWTAAKMTSYSPTRTITSNVKKGKTWNNDAWLAAKMTNYSPTRTITSNVKKGKTWNNDAWTAAKMTSSTITRTVQVVLKKKDWTTVEQYVDDNFGGATGGGGKTAGGGGGRYDVHVGLKQYTGWGDDSWTTVSGWVGQFSGDTPVEQIVGLISSGWYYVVDWVNGRIGGNATTGVDLTNQGTNWASGIVNFITGGLGYVSLAIEFATKTGNVVSSIAGALAKALGLKAAGGVFSNGIWSSIPQYAGGTTNAHGSLFLAGEAGPEIVGHVGGRTEVLNRSQLAATMYSAVQAAMAPAAANFAYAAENMSSDGVDMAALADMIQRGVEQALSRSNEYDRQQVELLRSINEKDFNPEISTGSINRAQQRANRRSGVTIVPVTT